MKRKTASSNKDTKQCKNRVIQRMAFKEAITLFAFNNIGIKNFTGKKGSCVKIPGVPL
jgi:hypothetical protein